MAKKATTRKKTASKTARRPSKQSLELHKIAHYAFFVGILLAIIAAFLRRYIPPEVLVTTLVLLGLIVGIFNLSAQETHQFLLAAIALMLAGIVNLSLIPVIGEVLRAMLSNIVVFVVPAAILVAFKTIWRLASD